METSNNQTIPYKDKYDAYAQVCITIPLGSGEFASHLDAEAEFFPDAKTLEDLVIGRLEKYGVNMTREVVVWSNKEGEPDNVA